MKTVTLISDWTLQDPYIAMFKGHLLSYIPDIQIIDITHTLKASDITQAAFIMRYSYHAFPKNTLHVSLSDWLRSSTYPIVCAEHDTHYFLAKDNGIFSLMFNRDEMPLAWSRPVHVDKETLQTREPALFDQKIRELIEMIELFFSGKMNTLCPAYSSFKIAFPCHPLASMSGNTLTGSIIYIDSAFNAVTNIPVSLFIEKMENRPFEARVRNKNLKTTLYYPTYHETDEIYLRGNPLGYLEIAFNESPIATLADLHVGEDTLEIMLI
ncbi:MAG: SAM-dependent chlorinase/fluorinase [Bacteroidales bacterium]|jgi:S-adenosylmethionine hydrolase|nr:SAM-dependent chlorinase/fluorinase [Bacteroidales bacterium]